jgi:hypothetical protein
MTASYDPRRFLGLSRPERHLFVRAMLVLPVVVVSLRLRGYERTRRGLVRLAGHRPAPTDPGSQVVAASRMVTAAAGRNPAPSACLARSLTLWFLLLRRGIHTEVVLGVRAEHDGTPVNETQDVVDSYARLERDA